METKLCPKCGTVNSEDANECQCGFRFDLETALDSLGTPPEGLTAADLFGSMTLNVRALALTGAIFWGAALFLVTWWFILFDGATGDAYLLGRLYRGYSISPLGSFVGLAWGVVDGAVSGAVIAWIYNLIVVRQFLKKSRSR